MFRHHLYRIRHRLLLRIGSTLAAQAQREPLDLVHAHSALFDNFGISGNVELCELIGR